MTPKHTFYTPETPVEGMVSLPEAEARHAARVLRLVKGDSVLLVDGRGTRLLADLVEVDRRGVVARIVSSERVVPSMPFPVTLGAGLIKNAGRFETMLEKAAELGAARIVPLETERSERSRLRMDRSRAILESAMKQSGAAHLVALQEPTPFPAFLDAAPESALKLICHEAVSSEETLLRFLAAHPQPDAIVLAVGPEGGFSDDEVGSARDKGFSPVSLGRARLRAETASIAALSVIAQHYPE